MNHHVVSLDRQLTRCGETITLRRPTKTTPVTYTDVQVRAVVTGFEPEELVAGISQDAIKVILSPSEIAAANWPGPPKLDRVIVQGRTRAVDAVTVRMIRDEAVRIELRVTG
jgi:hypothetical protein